MTINLWIEKANVEDSVAILAVQKLAFGSEARLYGGFQIPPLTETVEELKAKFATNLILKAVVDGRIVGSIRALTQDGTCRIGRVAVHPDFQKRGIATKLIREIERLAPPCERFELYTGEKSFNTIRLYERLGYKKFKVEAPADNAKLVFLEKTR